MIHILFTKPEHMKADSFLRLGVSIQSILRLHGIMSSTASKRLDETRAMCSKFYKER